LYIKNNRLSEAVLVTNNLSHHARVFSSFDSLSCESLPNEQQQSLLFSGALSRETFSFSHQRR
jgi:hypothetical protein